MSNTNTEVLTTAYEKLQGALTQSNTVLPKLEEAVKNADLSNYATTSDLEEKANESEVVKKGFGTLSDFDESTRAVLQGLSEGEINAVLGEKNVLPYNISDNLRKLFETNVYDISNCELGTIETTNGTNQDSTTKIRTDLLNLNSGDIIQCSSDYKFYILEYSGKTFVGLLQGFTTSYTFTANKSVKVVIGKTDNTDITDIELSKNVKILSASLFSYSNVNIDNLIEKSLLSIITTNPKSLSECELGTISATDGTNQDSMNRVRTGIITFSKGDKIYCSSTEKFYGIECDSSGSFVAPLFKFTNSYTFTENKNIRLVMGHTDNSTITDIDNFSKLFNCISLTNFNYTNPQIDALVDKKILKGKKWVVVGDSTTDSTVHTAKKYHYWIAQDTGITVVDFGKSGTGFKRTEDSNTAFYQRVTTIPTDADIVTIMGGGNDCSQSYTIGDITDTTTDTWCGAVNTTIDTILSRCPLADIAIISPYPWRIYPTNTSNKMKEISEKLKEIAENRGLIFLDLYKTSGVRGNVDEFNNYYFYNADGTHLNELGHKKFLYPRIKQLVLSMLDRLS